MLHRKLFLGHLFVNTWHMGALRYFLVWVKQLVHHTIIWVSPIFLCWAQSTKAIICLHWPFLVLPSWWTTLLMVRYVAFKLPFLCPLLSTLNVHTSPFSLLFVGILPSLFPTFSMSQWHCFKDISAPIWYDRQSGPFVWTHVKGKSWVIGLQSMEQYFTRETIVWLILIGLGMSIWE